MRLLHKNTSPKFNISNLIKHSLSVSTIMIGVLLIDDYHYRGDTYLSTSYILMLVLHVVLLTTLLFSYCYSTLRKTNHENRYYYTHIITGSLVIALAYSLVSHYVRLNVIGAFGFTGLIDISSLKDGLIALTVILICTLQLHIYGRQQSELENQRLQTETLLSHYEALEHQTDPHFLFNSLNTLSGLIPLDTNRAQVYLQHLAASYRYIMQQHRNVTLDEELTFTKHYIEMMNVRYEQSLIIEQTIDKELLEYTLPPISVQLLIENAIKHNVVSNLHPLTITITTDKDKNTVTVSNHIQPKQQPTNSEGIGLANLIQRYLLLYHVEPTITKTNETFTVTLPLIEATAQNNNNIDLSNNNNL